VKAFQNVDYYLEEKAGVAISKLFEEIKRR
jgi:hypothetical protein